jgi:hypothetical protein
MGVLGAQLRATCPCQTQAQGKAHCSCTMHGPVTRQQQHWQQSQQLQQQLLTWHLPSWCVLLPLLLVQLSLN